MDRTPEELICQIWDTEEKVGILHYLQTKEQFIKQMQLKSLDELMVRLNDAEKAVPDFTPNYVNELIHIQFDSCREHFSIEEEKEVSQLSISTPLSLCWRSNLWLICEDYS